MKKAVLAVLLFTSYRTFAQFAKGNMFIGGNLGVSIHNETADSPTAGNNTTYSSNSISIHPNFGFFLNDKIAIGAQLGYSNNTAESTAPPPAYNSTNKREDIQFGIFGKRYIKLADRFFFAGTGLLNYSKYTSTLHSVNVNSVVQNKEEGSDLLLSVSPSFLFFPSPKWGFEAGIGSIYYIWGLSHYDAGGTVINRKTNDLNISYGGFSVGFTYYFGKKSPKEETSK